MRSIWYLLEQQDNVLDSYRQQTESWLEWTPTWGLSVRFPAWEVRYRGSVTNGTGRPGVSDNRFLTPVAEGNVLVAPTGPLSLSGVRVMTHQVSISFPFR